MINSLKSLLGDGTGNLSAMRAVLFLIVLAVLIPLVIAAIKNGTGLTPRTSDLELLGIALGGKLLQNHQENSQPDSALPGVRPSPGAATPKPK